MQCTRYRTMCRVLLTVVTCSLLSHALPGAPMTDAQLPQVRKDSAPIVMVVDSSVNVSPAGKGTISVTVRVKTGWWIYSHTQKKAANGTPGPAATRIVLTTSRGLRLTAGFKTDAKVCVSRDGFWPGLDLEMHKGTVTWVAPIRVVRSTDPQDVLIRGKVIMTAESSRDARRIFLTFTARGWQQPVAARRPK